MAAARARMTGESYTIRGIGEHLLKKKVKPSQEKAMEKKAIKKLALTKETLRSLEGEELREALGATGPTERSYCKSCINTTCCTG